MDLIPNLHSVDSLALKTSNPRHIAQAQTVGFKGSFDHGGAIKEFGQGGNIGEFGGNIAELGTKIGTEAFMRTGSVGAAGLNRVDGANFSDAMLRAVDKVSGDSMRVEELEVAAMTDPSSVDAHDLTIAQAEASMSLGIARRILTNLTQAWKDIINTR
jgi:flagellar hook-basal body complex protein FliE